MLILILLYMHTVPESKCNVQRHRKSKTVWDAVRMKSASYGLLQTI